MRLIKLYKITHRHQVCNLQPFDSFKIKPQNTIFPLLQILLIPTLVGRFPNKGHNKIYNE